MTSVSQTAADVSQIRPIEGASGAVLIVGAGPAGMAVSRCLTDINVAHEIVDRHGECGGAYRLMYSGVQLSSPPRYLALPGAGPPVNRGYVNAGQYATYLKEYAEAMCIKVRKDEVKSVRRNGDDFDVLFANNNLSSRYRAVIICTGSFECPHIPPLPGLTTSSQAIRCIHASKWSGPSELLDKTVLIIGARITGVEIAEECVQAGIKPLVSANIRSIPLYPRHVLGVNPRLLIYPFMRYFPLMFFKQECERGWRYRGVNRGFARYVAEGRIVVKPQVVSAQGANVAFSDGSVESVDSVVFATGYRHNMPFLPEEIPRRSHGVPKVRRGESIDWPGLYVLGVPCSFAGNSQFVFGIVADARRVARSIATRLARARAS